MRFCRISTIALADPQRRLIGLLARLPRQGLGIVEEDEVDVGGIIELAPAQFAEAEDREAARRRSGRPLGDRRGQRALELAVGEVGQRRRHLVEPAESGEIGDAERRAHGRCVRAAPRP